MNLKLTSPEKYLVIISTILWTLGIAFIPFNATDALLYLALGSIVFLLTMFSLLYQIFLIQSALIDASTTIHMEMKTQSETESEALKTKPISFEKTS